MPNEDERRRSADSLPHNHFKQALLDGRQQIGLWCSLPGPYVAEAMAGSGFDWMLFDTEHSPGDPVTVLAQLQAVAPYPVSPVVRPASNDAVLIKRFLDIGAQTLLIPYVQNVAEAKAAVAAMRYPPAGIRGVAASTRATRFGRVADYGKRAHEQLCLLVQVETRAALDQLAGIANVDGVDGVFIGPGDLAASSRACRGARTSRGSERDRRRHRQNSRLRQAGGNPHRGHRLRQALHPARNDLHGRRRRCRHSRARDREPRTTVPLDVTLI